MELANWWLLMCCWCFSRKDEDEKALDAAEQEQKQEMEATKKKTDEGPVVQKQPATPPRLFHAPKLKE